jgi:hypothetical protein
VQEPGGVLQLLTSGLVLQPVLWQRSVQVPEPDAQEPALTPPTPVADGSVQPPTVVGAQTHALTSGLVLHVPSLWQRSVHEPLPVVQVPLPVSPAFVVAESEQPPTEAGAQVMPLTVTVPMPLAGGAPVYEALIVAVPPLAPVSRPFAPGALEPGALVTVATPGASLDHVVLLSSVTSV